jgi:hypothetical protein
MSAIPFVPVGQIDPRRAFVHQLAPIFHQPAPNLQAALGRLLSMHSYQSPIKTLWSKPYTEQ